MVFLPKLPAGELGWAADTRPLNIANGESRLLANTVRLSFERAMSEWASEMQRGFLLGRSILLNVLEVVHRMQLISLKGQGGAAVFFDFQAAFPSVVHDFLLEVLDFIGVPLETMTFIRNLYFRNRCSLVVGGDIFEGFEMHSGIHQGCPLSPLIFAVAMDVLLRRACRLLPEALVRAYADDLCVAADDFWQQLPVLQRLMQEFANCSGLELNVRKTVVVPLAPGDPDAWRDRLLQGAPAWSPLKLAHSAKYLGYIFATVRNSLQKSRNRPEPVRNSLQQSTAVSNTCVTARNSPKQPRRSELCA
jgi:hypothetical protein